MKIGYLDCISGISGDMLLGALVDLGVPLHLMDEAVQSLGIPGVSLVSETVSRKGFRATKVNVLAPHEHVHRHLSDILELVENSSVITHDQKIVIDQLFQRIAEAEAKAHGIEIEKVHFHEVGAVDSIADVVAGVVGLEFLNLDQIISSPIPTGTGTMQIAHGRCSIPAPATAELLLGVPIAPSDIPFELTTPTGAAFLSVFVGDYGPLPSFRVEKIGYGAGTRDLEDQPNVLRFLIGEHIGSDRRTSSGDQEEAEGEPGPSKYKSFAEKQLAEFGRVPLPSSVHDFDHQFDLEFEGLEQVPASSGSFTKEHWEIGEEERFSEDAAIEEKAWIVETNLDDIGSELIAYCVEKLWKPGVYDVYTTPITMKKGRPGVVLSVLCRESVVGEVQNVLFSETTTLGVRRYQVFRTILNRMPCSVQTPWGKVEGKIAVLPGAEKRFTPEYESAKRIAAKENVPLQKVYESAIAAYHEAERKSTP